MLLVVTTAHAYVLEGDPLPDETFPLEIHWTGAVEGMDAEETAAAIEGAVATWTGAIGCEREILAVEDADAGVWFEAGGAAILLGDPWDELEEGLAATSYRTDEPASFALVVNDGFLFASDAAIAAGECTDAVSLQAFVTHELGHPLGLGHSCEMGEPCDEEEAAATMSGVLGLCDSAPSTLEADDEAGIDALYGCDDAGPPGDDTGVTAEDTAEEQDSASEDTGEPTGEGCGCATSGASGGIPVLLALLALRGRRG